MLPEADFIPALRSAVPRFRPQVGRGPSPNAEQEACILAPCAVPLQIVAGPGSGKTTVLVLRALRHVVVDGMLPEQVLLTTFTRKAADEIRTRLIEWGQLLINDLRRTASGPLAHHLGFVDVNRFITGTLDSVCEEAVRSLRAATDAAPALLEGFAADAILLRRGLNGSVYVGGNIDPGVAQYLATFTLLGSPPANAGELVRVVRPLFDRFSHDEIDLAAYATGPNPAVRALLVQAYQAYAAALSSTNRLDFARLETLFLDRLRTGRLARMTASLRAILVDEYQDTNLLQERIYFELFRQTKGAFSVVGDDDQSLYRFRGATVELFRDFRPRLASEVAGANATRIDLVSNYRSTPEIVHFFNSFVVNDPDFGPARVQPPKPRIRATRPSNGATVIGMFRASAQDLARDLATFIHDVFRGPGRPVNGVGGKRVTVRAANPGGDIGDAVFLSHSVNEFTSGFMGAAPRARLPNHLRAELTGRNIGVFNPRGQALRDILHIQRIVGAMLECIDPGAARQGGMRLRGAAIQHLNAFREAYRNFAASRPAPTAPHGIGDFVAAWGRRHPQGGGTWPSAWPVLELAFKLLSWFPRLRDDPEGQVHLEAVARAIAQSASFSPYRAQILHGSGAHDARSVESAIRDIFGPLAEELIDVDEDIMPFVPRDRLAMMTVHQAKGLEFPLVIVDVGSDYKTNHRAQRFRRFPDQPSNVALAEDDLAPSCAVGALRTGRTAIQRTFEDLIRLYYVAYSRPESVLLLVGHEAGLRYSTPIRNVAKFWRRNATWAWTTPVPGRPPALANAIPMELI